MSNTLPPVEFVDKVDDTKERYARIVKARMEEAKRKIKNTTDSPQEMYKSIENSLNKSKSGLYEDFFADSADPVKSPSLPKSRFSYPHREEDIVKTIPIDNERKIEIRTNPHLPNRFEYAAVKKELLNPKQTELQKLLDWPPDVPRNVDKDIASLFLDDTGYVDMVRGSYTGAKEKAIDRLLMEAVRHDMSPHSNMLLNPGKNMVSKYVKEFRDTPKEEYLKKIRNFLDTGKTGKLWSTVAPYIGPAGTALTAGAILSAPNPAEAAILEGMSNVIPGGVSELGVSDEQKDLDRQFFKRIRQSSQRQGK